VAESTPANHEGIAVIRTIIVRLYAVLGALILLGGIAMMTDRFGMGLFMLGLFGIPWLLLFWCFWPFFKKSNA
jgi:hypothetical protein